jgi:hypothetical protein
LHRRRADTDTNTDTETETETETDTETDPNERYARLRDYSRLRDGFASALRRQRYARFHEHETGAWDAALANRVIELSRPDATRRDAFRAVQAGIDLQEAKRRAWALPEVRRTRFRTAALSAIMFVVALAVAGVFWFRARDSLEVAALLQLSYSRMVNSRALATYVHHSQAMAASNFFTADDVASSGELLADAVDRLLEVHERLLLQLAARPGTLSLEYGGEECMRLTESLCATLTTDYEYNPAVTHGISRLLRLLASSGDSLALADMETMSAQTEAALDFVSATELLDANGGHLKLQYMLRDDLITLTFTGQGLVLVFAAVQLLAAALLWTVVFDKPLKVASDQEQSLRVLQLVLINHEA